MDKDENPILGMLILFLSMVACGLIAIYFGKELNWDLANYHYYNPYAFLNQRSHFDFWPTSFMHQYLNPLLDCLSYFLINTFPPIVTEFLLGALSGFDFFLLFIIAKLLTKNNSLSFLTAILGFYGPTVLPGIGSFYNDNITSIFVLACLYLQLKCLMIYSASAKLNKKIIFLSGLLLGLGMGIKLTLTPFVLGGVLASFFLPFTLNKRFLFSVLFTAGLLCGFFITSGYWSLMLWKVHHNPFFPFLNGIFHSPDFDFSNLRDTRFLPKTIAQYLFYPFYFSFDGRTGDFPFRDIRFLITYLLFTVSFLLYLLSCFTRYFTSPQIKLPTRYLFTFFIFSYLVWQSYFAIARYLAPLEMLAPLIIYLLIKHLIKTPPLGFSLMAILFYALFLFMIPMPMARIPIYGKHFFNVAIPSHFFSIKNASVLISYPAYGFDSNPRPQSYLIPFFPTGWRFIGIPFRHDQSSLSRAEIKKIMSLIDKHHAIYLLTTNLNMNELYHVAQGFHLSRAGSCEAIFSDRQAISRQDVFLCPVK